MRDHWQVIKHAGAGAATEGRTEAVALDDTPQAVLDTAIAAARLIGDGFYGVDLKQTDAGVFVIEINDNPNLDVGAEDKSWATRCTAACCIFCWPSSKGARTRPRRRQPPRWPAWMT